MVDTAVGTVSAAGRDRATNGARPIRRRTALPGGRAVVGGFLVAVAMAGTFAAYTSATATPQQRYVVARHALTVGSRLTRVDLTLTPMRLPSAVGFTSIDAVLGATVVGPVGRGEVLQSSSLLDTGSRPGDRQLSVPIESARAVGGELRAGDRVDVAATFGTGSDAYTVFVVRGAQILARNDGSGSLGARQDEVIVLALPSATDALAVAHAIAVGQLSVVRATGAQPAGPEPYRAPAAPGSADLQVQG
jgi:Flp pilus assembly protein CpaB